MLIIRKTFENNKSMSRKQLGRIERHILSLARNLDKSGFYEYIQYVNDEKRIIRRSFKAGLAKGVGSAIGFTILGAIVIMLLRLLADSSIPYIADFIAEIIRVIDESGR